MWTWVTSFLIWKFRIFLSIKYMLFNGNTQYGYLLDEFLFLKQYLEKNGNPYSQLNGNKAHSHACAAEQEAVHLKFKWNTTPATGIW